MLHRCVNADKKRPGWIRPKPRQDVTIPYAKLNKPALTRYPLIFMKPGKLRRPEDLSLLVVIFLILPRLARRVRPEHENLIRLITLELGIDTALDSVGGGVNSS